MDPVQVSKIRKKYPNHLPVVVEAYPDPAEKPHKLIMPHNKTGAECAKLIIEKITEKCEWATPDSKVLLKKGHIQIPHDMMVSDLDHPKFKAEDNVLYVLVERKSKDRVSQGPPKHSRAACTDPLSTSQAEVKSSSEPEEEIDMSKSFVEFKMKDSSANQVMTVMTDEFGQAEKAKKMRLKYPDRVPVLVNQPATPGIPEIERKLLVPKAMKPCDLRKSLPKHLKLKDKDGNDVDLPWDRVKMLMAGEELEDEEQRMGDIYDFIVDKDDGGLHLTLELDDELALIESSAPEPAEPAELAPVKPEDKGPSFEQVKRLEMSLVEAEKEVQEAQRKRVETQQMLHEERQRTDSAEQVRLEAEIKVEKLQQENEMCKDNLYQAEKTIDALQQDRKRCQEDLKKEIEARMDAESRVQSLQQEAHSKERMLNAAHTTVRNSGAETTAAKEKSVELEGKVLALQRSSKNDEEAILRLKDMCKKLKDENAALTSEKEDVVAERDRMVGRRVYMEEKLQEQQKHMQDKMKEMEKERMQMEQMLQQFKADLEAAVQEKLKLEEEVTALKAAAREEDEESDEEDDFIECGWDVATLEPIVQDDGELNFFASP
mmetsp:Transcript_64952/g.131938  ORF Transcript_64952/g.131938 Transcript_64952/m.131938 type:complete len:601 (-) Transcript_64952:53-1855(-)